MQRNLLYLSSVQKSEDGGSKNLWNVSQFIPDYAVPCSVRLYSWRGFFVVCVDHWTVVWDGQTNQIQIMKFISLRSIVIPRTSCPVYALTSQVGLLPWGLPTKLLPISLVFLARCHSLFGHPSNIRHTVEIMTLFIVHFTQYFCFLPPSLVQIFSQAPCSRTH